MPTETARFTQRQNLDVPLIAATDTSFSFAYGGRFFAENPVRPSVLRALRPPAKIHPQSQYVGGLTPHSPVITLKCRKAAAWAWQSAARLSNRMVAACGPAPTTGGAPRLTSLYPFKPTRRDDRRLSGLISRERPLALSRGAACCPLKKLLDPRV